MSHKRNLLVIAVSLIAILLVGLHQAQAGGDTSGKHAFFNDDRNQFVDAWLNTDGNVTIKVSNGRPWRPMWVVVHVNFGSAGHKDYHVYCPSPNPGGGGSEVWFKFPGPGSYANDISVTTNKEEPWKHVKEGWVPMISVSAPAP